MILLLRKLALPTLLTLLLISLASPLMAQSRQRVQFASGNDNTAVESVVTGKQYRDFVLGARAGQKMSVSLITKGSAYFNILPPGSKDVALFVGSRDGNDATIKLPANGDYTIRVYLMGNDRDSGRKVLFTLSMTIM